MLARHQSSVDRLASSEAAQSGFFYTCFAMQNLILKCLTLPLHREMIEASLHKFEA